MIPGLIDSRTHVIRGGLNYNMELRWDGVPSPADALRMLKEQVRRTPAPLCVRVVGGFNEYQFAEKRMPTLRELNDAAPHAPVFILRLYDRAMLNRAALRATGFTKHTKDFPVRDLRRDHHARTKRIREGEQGGAADWQPLVLRSRGHDQGWPARGSRGASADYMNLAEDDQQIPRDWQEEALRRRLLSTISSWQLPSSQGSPPS